MINATPIGIEGFPKILPVPQNAILPDTVVLDMVNSEIDTAFLVYARSLSCTCINGRSVFIKQALMQHLIWLLTIFMTLALDVSSSYRLIISR